MILQIEDIRIVHSMIFLFIWLLLVGAVESRMTRQERAAGCSWIGHCAGDRCSTYDDCDGSMICINGKCSDGTSGGGGTCSPSGELRGRR